jgi:DTW domain-containing protein YfiP
VAKGVVKTITATASNAGAVTFYINGKRVPGCVNVKTQSSVATCNWKPSVQGSVTLSAILFPSDSEVSNVKSTPINLAIGRRTGRR